MKTGSGLSGTSFIYPMNIILDYNRTLYDPDANALYRGVPELLERLATKNTLFLVSRNEPGRQDRLEELGIKSYFRDIAFVEDKTIELFSTMSNGGKETCVVGDRIREEIRLGNDLGLITIWVRQGKFAEEIPANSSEKPTHAIRSIIDLEKILTAYEI